MDTKQLESILQTLTDSKESLKRTATFCSSYPESASLISQMIEDEFLTTRKDRKKLFLFLIHQIVLDESQIKRQGTPFIKFFGGKLKKILSDFCLVDDIRDMENVYTIIKRWEKDQIYHPTFLQKLRTILQPKYDQLKQQQDTFNALNQIDQSAIKALSLSIQNVQSIEQSNSVYKLLKQQSEIDSRTLEFNCNYDKFQDQKTSNLELKQLIEQGEFCRDELIASISQLQDCYKSVANQGQLLLNSFTSAEHKSLDYYKTKRRELFQV